MLDNCQSLKLLNIEKAINRNPLVVKPDDILSDVINLMAMGKHSCALIIKQQLVGILTEKDIVQLIAAGIFVQHLPIKEVMNKKTITLKLDQIDDIFSILSQLRYHQIHHLPIVDQSNQLFGVITPKMIQRILRPINLLKIRKVREVINHKVIHTTANIPLLEIAQLMTINQVSCVVITHTEKPAKLKPLGMITEQDIISLRAQGLDFTHTKVQEVMSSPMIVTQANESLWAAHKLMQYHHLHRLVIVDQNGYLVGLVNQTNIMQVLEPVGIYSTVEALQTVVEEKTAALVQANQKLKAEIAERQQLETELNHFFNFSRDMLCIVGFDGYFRRLNPIWEQTLGFSQEELFSQPFMALVHPEEKASVLAEAQKLIHGIEIISFESRYRCRDGSYRWFLWTATPLPEKKLIYGIAHDITNRKEYEQKLQQINADLTRSNQELEQFAYVASHDLQEPLRKIKGYTDLLSHRYQEQLDERANKYLDYISDSVLRMQALIKDLLTYSRVSTTQPIFKPIKLETLLNQTINDLSPGIEESQAKILTQSLPTVCGNPRLLGQLLQNLLANAIKFRSSQPPYITICATRQGKFWQIAIEDNGIGIESIHAERIFVLFQRLHCRDDYPGTGIGLTICQKIVELHGGKIWFESTPGLGTTFFFTLPMG